MTILSTDPADNEAIGLGASRIRDTRVFLLGAHVHVDDAGAIGDDPGDGTGTKKFWYNPADGIVRFAA